MPRVQANGIGINYEAWGPESAAAVVFAHSVGTSRAMWAPQVAALAGRFRVIAYDARGHGDSDVVDRPVTVMDYADDLVGLLDALKIERAHVVGLSLGGMAAQAFAIRHGARLGRLVLMATTAHFGAAMDWEERTRRVRADGLGWLVDATMSPRWFTPAFAEREPATIAAFRRGFLATDPVGYAVASGAIATLDLRPGLGGIAAPTLVIAGALDPATPPAMGEAIRAGIPDAELVVLPKVAHLLSTEAADKVNAHLLAFLDRDRGAGGERAEPAALGAGLANRRAVLGPEHVARSMAAATGFSLPWQRFISRYAWGEIWGDATLPWKTRSLLVLTTTLVLGREEEFKLHVRPALRNGVSLDELRALLTQAAVYAGVPAANNAFRWVQEVLGDELGPPAGAPS